MQKSFLEKKHISKTGIIEIFSQSSYRKPLLLSAMLMLMQQFSGIKVINSYIVQIFQNAGGKVRDCSEDNDVNHNFQFDANICAIVVGVIQVTGTSLSVLVVDKSGRRKLLIISEFFICISFCLLSSFFFIQVRVNICMSQLLNYQYNAQYNDCNLPRRHIPQSLRSWPGSPWPA